MKKNKQILALVAVAFVAAALFIWKDRTKTTTDGRSNLVELKFGMLPYGDHTQAIIGIQKGWFEEVGIKLKPEVIKIENVAPFLANGTVDLCSTPAGLLYPAYESAPGLGVFVFADIFQGYAVVAQPGLNCKSYEEFKKEGLSSEDAFRATVAQMKGKSFAYPSETAIKPFIDLVVEKGGITRNDFTSLVQDDSMTINLMRQKKADFQVGGAPSRVVLAREGFKPILTSLDIARSAKPSHLSRELGSVFPDGWACTKKFYGERRDVILRVASVCFRINDLIVHKTDEALAIHMPFLSKATGEAFSIEDGRIIYTSLNPFYTYEQQRSWYENEQDPFYYKHINGAGLQSFVDQGVYKNKAPGLDEFIYADDVFKELDALRISAAENMKALSDRSDLSTEAKRKLTIAQRHFEIYNYYDAQLLSKQALEGTK